MPDTYQFNRFSKTIKLKGINVTHIPSVESWTESTNLHLVSRMETELRIQRPDLYADYEYQRARFLVMRVEEERESKRWREELQAKLDKVKKLKRGEI
jgi:hypothetical protein